MQAGGTQEVAKPEIIGNKNVDLCGFFLSGDGVWCVGSFRAFGWLKSAGNAMNGKRKGSRNEHRSMAILEAAGYACTRAAASLGLFDVIGVGSADVVLVQVKSNEWPRSEEMESLRGFRCPPNARKLIHRWRDRVKLPDVKEL